MAETEYHGVRRPTSLKQILDSPEVASLMTELEETRVNRGPGHPIHAMVGLGRTGAICAVPTWSHS